MDGVFSRKERKDHKAGGPTSVSATIDRSGWKRVRLGEVCTIKARIGWQGLKKSEYLDSGNYCLVSGTDFRNGFVNWNTCSFVSKWRYNQDTNIQLKNGDVLITKDGTIGKVAYVHGMACPTTLNSGIFVIRPTATKLHPAFLQLIFKSRFFTDFLDRITAGSTIVHLYQKDIVDFDLPIPNDNTQLKIVDAIQSIDKSIDNQEAVIAKYEAIKKATVNLLLEPKAGWKRMKLDEICMCLDNYREPVNEVERASMHGDIPYCGANGIVDYVNDFTIDDSIILIAEDGGYFDQYESRPIAYRMSGKAWINNHAHILKAKRDYCQDFIFYSLEHKDITPFITSGTRAKLTKGELSNIEIDTPPSFQEQRKIAEKIIAIDNALADYKAQLEKARKLKAGMMSYFFG